MLHALLSTLKGALGAVIGVLFVLLLLVIMSRFNEGHHKEIDISTRQRTDSSSKEFRSLRWLNNVLSMVFYTLISTDDFGGKISQMLSDICGGNNVLQSLTMVDLLISPNPPSIESVTTNRDASGQTIAVSVFYRPELSVDTKMALKMPIVGTQYGEAFIDFKEAAGTVIISFPTGDGVVNVQPMKGMRFDLDVRVKLGFVSLSSGMLGRVWEMLISIITGYIQNLVIPIDFKISGQKNDGPKRENGPSLVKFAFEFSSRPVRFLC